MERAPLVFIEKGDFWELINIRWYRLRRSCAYERELLACFISSKNKGLIRMILPWVAELPDE